MKTFYALLLALGICLGLTFPAMAEYPAKPIMLMTAFNAGGGSDLSHRLIEKFAKGVIPQPIVVTYKAGAGGEIGWTWLVGAKADGYNIGGVDLPHIVLQPMLRPEGQPGYKTEQLNPLCCLVFDPDILIVSEKSPFKSFGELIEYAKANPGKVKAATVGKLTGDHIFHERGKVHRRAVHASPLSRRQQSGPGATRRRSGLLFRFHIQLPAYAGRARPRHCNQGSL